MEIVGFTTNDGPFRGRQHVVNHVDMVLGIGGDGARIRKGRLLRTEMMRGGREIAVASLSDERLAIVRDELLRLSTFACEWQQLMPEVAEDQMIPEDFRSLDDGIAVLDACVRRWTDTLYSGDSDAFWTRTAAVVLLACWDPVTCDRIVIRKSPDGVAEDFPAPKNGRDAMRKLHGGSLAWKAFAERICANDFVKATLAECQGGICPICEAPLGRNAVVHHVDYDHECVRIKVGGNCSGKVGWGRLDCKECSIDSPEWFRDCLSRLRAVHGDCNYLIEGML